ncbi:hypothetical protein [Parasulfitobacter algicola]|uniref:Uncharacterized protein n=1 Tax=Parasulfitobacter algicola TaxID=2614809 RepID=A0ABX2IUW0_9RHOB|nr:hypothetical protein [Sulfitobacter algicola]NSX56688.1 hypothetical protein [Sulfitobacter algicola]
MDDAKDKPVLSQEAKQAELFKKLGMIETVANGAGVCVCMKKKEEPTQLLANAAWALSKQDTYDLAEEDALVHFSGTEDYDHIAVVLDPEARASFSDQIMTDLTYRAIEIVGLIQTPAHNLPDEHETSTGAMQ